MKTYGIRVSGIQFLISHPDQIKLNSLINTVNINALPSPPPPPPHTSPRANLVTNYLYLYLQGIIICPHPTPPHPTPPHPTPTPTAPHHRTPPPHPTHRTALTHSQLHLLKKQRILFSCSRSFSSIFLVYFKIFLLNRSTPVNLLEYYTL